MSKIIKSLIIILLVLVIVLLTFTMVFFIKNDFGSYNFGNYTFGNSKLELIDSYEAEVSAADKIFLDLNSADVEIAESDNGKISVKYYSNIDTDVKIENTDKTITVDENKSTDTKTPQNFFNLRKKVVIFVPKGYTGEYELNSTSGDIMAENDLSANAVNISSTSGDVSVNVTGDINISTNSGDVKINKIIKKAAVTTSSGDISIVKADLEEASDITTSSGDVTISTLNMKDNLNITTSSGDIDVEEKECNCYVETDTSSGDVSVNRGDRKSDFVLSVKTSSGDITVH